MMAVPPAAFWAQRAAMEPLLAAPRLLAAFDYDGTLVPIAPTPEEAVAGPETRRALAALAMMPGTRVAVVSGRPAARLRELVGAAGAWLVGLHGLEVAAPGEAPRPRLDLEASAAALGPLRAVAVELAGRHPGVRVEDKGPTLALHTRLAARADATLAGGAFREAAAAVPGYEVMAGKEVLEARPAGVHKGGAVVDLLKAWEKASGGDVAVLYVGDDVTDEDAFRALGGAPLAVTVQVGGSGETAARYRLDDQREVAQLLAWLAELRGWRGA
jgi:trehalose 6-phosphate phosphatase